MGAFARGVGVGRGVSKSLTGSHTGPLMRGYEGGLCREGERGSRGLRGVKRDLWSQQSSLDKHRFPPPTPPNSNDGVLRNKTKGLF